MGHLKQDGQGKRWSAAMLIEILDPRAEPGAAITPYGLRMDMWAPDLKVGLLSNCFFDASNLLLALGDALLTQLPLIRVQLYESRNASVAAASELIAQVASESDVAVTALGHCGSCTSSATRNAVALARAGVPVCALVTVRFAEACSFIARSVGMPDIPRVHLPHRVAGTGSARIATIAHAAAPAVVATWKGDHAIAA
jgi:hypothetical protein